MSVKSTPDAGDGEAVRPKPSPEFVAKNDNFDVTRYQFQKTIQNRITGS